LAHQHGLKEYDFGQGIWDKRWAIYWKLHQGSLTSNKTWGLGNFNQKKYLFDITLGNLYNMHHPMQTTNTIVDS
jgi:4-alpha-glucanotransferase